MDQLPAEDKALSAAQISSHNGEIALLSEATRIAADQEAPRSSRRNIAV